MRNAPLLYPEYKDSGLAWLGHLPAHWGVRASKRLFRDSSERAWPDDEQLSATQSHGVILQKEYERLVGRKVVRILHHLEKRKHVEKDDFVISMRSFQGGLERAWCCGAIRSSYVVLKPKAIIHVPYFEHLFKSHPYIQALRKTSEFIRDGQDLTFSNFSLVPLPVVPMDEQKAIARYLDANAAKIRRFIHNRRRLIHVLSEQKQAIINHAVTRGLDPDAALRATNIAWLGEIPAHWQHFKLKRIARINPSRAEAFHLRDSEEPVVFLPMERVSSQGDVDGELRRPIHQVWQGFTYFRRGDVVVAKITPCFENGKGACLIDLPTEIGFGTTEFIVLRPGREVSAEFLYQLTQLTQFRLLGVESMTGAAGQQRVSQDFVASFEIPLPPANEQHEIVAFIRSESERFRMAINRAQREIDLIREYRIRLVADVVTGKVDVRGIAPTYPPATYEPINETIDEEDATIEDDAELGEEAAHVSADES